MIVEFEIPDAWTSWALIACGWTILVGYGFLVMLLLREIVSLQYKKIDQLLSFGELYAFAVEWKRKKDEKKVKR
jgi:hypothetical protein